MHYFSIDNKTGDSADYSRQYGAVTQYQPSYPSYPPGQPDYQYPVKQEYPDTGDVRTPSPSDSGIDISYSSRHSDASKDDVSKALLKLSKTSEALVKPEATSHEKPQHSCIALICMAIQSSRDGKLLLGDIYRYIMDNFPYYNSQQRAWRNNIRYTLSINGCFLKAGRSDCGKSNYWAIHPAVADDFAKGDYSRRQSSRRKLRNKVKSSSGNVPAQKHGGFVAVKAETIGYHPYNTGARYHATPTYGLATSGHQQTTSPYVPASSDNTPNVEYSDIYLNSYTQPTSPSTRGYYSQPSTDYDTMTSKGTNYGYDNISGLCLPGTTHVDGYTYLPQGTW